MKALAAALARVLANRSIRHAQVGWFIAIAAQWAYLVAVLVYAYDVGGVVAAGLASTVRMLPAALAAPFTTSWRIVCLPGSCSWRCTPAGHSPSAWWRSSSLRACLPRSCSWPSPSPWKD